MTERVEVMHPAREFFETWADVYDQDYENQEIGDVEFYLDMAREADGPVLEVGCGTGRIYLELLKAGVDAYGIDISREMLAVLEDKASEASLSPQVRKADMTEFEPHREYSLIIIPFRTFLHNVTVTDRKAALRNFRDALEPNGTLALNIFVPSFDVICDSYGEPETRTITRDNEDYVVRTLTTIDDEIEQIVQEERSLERNGEILREATFQLALVSKSEFELLLETTGWSEWSVYGGFDRAPLDEDATEMIWIAEK